MSLRISTRTGIIAIIDPIMNSPLGRWLPHAIWRPIFTVTNKTSSVLQRLPVASANAVRSTVGSVTDKSVSTVVFFISIAWKLANGREVCSPGVDRERLSDLDIRWADIASKARLPRSSRRIVNAATQQRF